MSDFKLLVELALHELRYQQRETFLGFIWMVLWPLIQAGGFMLAFSLIRGGEFSNSLLTTYLGVLVWSTTAMILINSLGFFNRNAEMIRHMVFPFHLIMLNEVNVKFGFFVVQLGIAAGWFLVQQSAGDLLLIVASLLVYIVSLYIVAVAMSWLGSLVGVLLPDLALALPPVLLLLLTLSPVFHRDLAALPREIVWLNLFNPLSHLVEGLYGCLGIGGPVQPPYVLAGVAVLALLASRLGVRRLYQELAKIV